MIRKSLFIFFLSILGVINIVAQESSKPAGTWNIGASFGLNFSEVNFQKATTKSTVKSKLWQQYQGGLAIRYITEKNLGLIVEVNYSQQGWQQNFEDKNSKDTEWIELLDSFHHEHQMNYLNVPFLTHIYFGNKVRFFFNLGPQIGILLSESEKFNDELTNYLSGGNAESSFLTDQYYQKANRKFDYGIVVGMGMEMQTGIGNFSLEGRYTFGLGDFYDNNKSAHFQRSAHRAIGVKMTYYVKLF